MRKITSEQARMKPSGLQLDLEQTRPFHRLVSKVKQRVETEPTASGSETTMRTRSQRVLRGGQDRACRVTRRMGRASGWATRFLKDRQETGNEWMETERQRDLACTSGYKH